MNKLIKAVGLAIILGLYADCGPGGGSPVCTPNVIDSGIQANINALTSGSSTYAVQLCADAQPSNAVYTVYGGINLSDVSQGTINLAGAARLANITATTSTGAAFQVTFRSSDNYFAIYRDQFSGGQYVLDSTTAMVSARKIPGR